MACRPDLHQLEVRPTLMIKPNQHWGTQAVKPGESLLEYCAWACVQPSHYPPGLGNRGSRRGWHLRRGVQRRGEPRDRPIIMNNFP
jgi:hypothetical protein